MDIFSLCSTISYRPSLECKRDSLLEPVMDRVCIIIIIYQNKCYCELLDAVNLAVTPHDLVLFAEMQKNLVDVGLCKDHSILESLG